MLGIAEDSNLGVHFWAFFAEFDEVIGFHSLFEFEQSEVIFEDWSVSIFFGIEITLNLIGFALFSIGCEVESDVLVLLVSFRVKDVMRAAEYKILGNEQSRTSAYGLSLLPSEYPNVSVQWMGHFFLFDHG